MSAQLSIRVTPKLHETLKSISKNEDRSICKIVTALAVAGLAAYRANPEGFFNQKDGESHD